MKIMFLNAWWGTTGDLLWKYLDKESKIVDIFCFMETGDKFAIKCNEVLPNFTLVSTSKKVINEVDHSILVYIKKNGEILTSEVIIGDKQTHDLTVGVFV